MVGRVRTGTVWAILRYAIIEVTHGAVHFPSNDSETPFTAHSHRCPRPTTSPSTNEGAGDRLGGRPRHARHHEAGGPQSSRHRAAENDRHHPLRHPGRKRHTCPRVPPHPRRHRRRLRPADKPARAATPSPDPPAKCAPPVGQLPPPHALAPHTHPPPHPKQHPSPRIPDVPLGRVTRQHPATQNRIRARNRPCSRSRSGRLLWGVAALPVTALSRRRRAAPEPPDRIPLHRLDANQAHASVQPSTRRTPDHRTGTPTLTTPGRGHQPDSTRRLVRSALGVAGVTLTRLACPQRNVAARPDGDRLPGGREAGCPEFGVGPLWYLGDLPGRFAGQSTVLFARRFLVTAVSLTGSLTRDKPAQLSCVAEIFLLNFLLRETEGDHLLCQQPGSSCPRCPRRGSTSTTSPTTW